MQAVEGLFVNIDNWFRAWLTSLGVPEAWVFLAATVVYLIGVLIFAIVNILWLDVMERKVGGYMQDRYGPNRVGPGGVLQGVADAFKLLGKEDIIHSGVDKWLFRLASFLIFMPAIALFAVIPYGKGMTAADINVGLLYFIAVGSTATVVLLMGGWGSNNKYSLLGAMRSVAQMIAYEIPLVFSLLGVIMIAGSLRLGDIVAAQENVWFIIMQPVAFITYFIAATAELGRGPFDLPEGEQEIIAGPYVEFSGMRWALFYLSEYANLVSVSALAATIFLGGWQGPWLPSWLWFIIKMYIMIFLFMWVRWTFPRIRIDHLMGFAWKYLIPVTLANVFVTGVAIKVFQVLGW